MIRVLLSNEIEDFEIKGSYRDSTGESNDGMRRSYSFEVSTWHTFTFKAVGESELGYEYDMEVVYTTSSGIHADWTKSEAAFRENFQDIYSVLRKREVGILNYPAKLVVHGEFRTALSETNCNGKVICTEPDEEAVGLKFTGKITPLEEGETAMSAFELMRRVGERDDERKRLQLARALDNIRPFTTDFVIQADTLPPKYLGKTFWQKLKKVDLGTLIASGEVGDEDVKQALMEFAEDVGNKGGYFQPLPTNGIEQYITTLPGDWPAKVLRYCQKTRDNLDLYRKYCPQAIPWREMKSEDYCEGDLDLMIRCKEPAYNCEQWEFIETCMQDPELERKVVENAGIIGLYSYGRIGRNLHTMKANDVLRAVLKYLDADPGKVYLDHFEHLAKLKLEDGLTEKDYQDFLRVARRLDKTSSDVAGLALKIGKSAGMSDVELVKMLEQKEFASDLCDSGLYAAYRETQFAPGLAWIEAQRAQWEAEKQAAIEARERSYAAVVDYVLQSKKTAVPVQARYSFDEEGAYGIARPDGTEIGILRSTEKRVLRIEGREHSYLVNVARAKRPRGGVLHIDILEADAGYVIGPKGAHLEKVAQQLREYGCDVRTVRAHKHTALAEL